MPHGHVAAVLGSLKNIGLESVISAKPCREQRLVIALIVLRIIAPGSKLANFTGLQTETAQNSLASELGIQDIELTEIYDAMDWP